MKKSAFANLLLGVIGGLLFSVGLCMCLLPEWASFNEGMVIAAVGIVILLALLIRSRIRSGKPARKPNWKLIGKIAFGVFGALVMGLGMCMVLVWQFLLPGIIVGIAGIVLLLFLIPMCMGLK